MELVVYCELEESNRDTCSRDPGQSHAQKRYKIVSDISKNSRFSLEKRRNLLTSHKTNRRVPVDAFCVDVHICCFQLEPFCDIVL